MQWISVKDRLPELEHPVLFYDGEDIFVGYYYRSPNKNETFFAVIPANDGWNMPDEPTHWMPLPEVPE